ncbi:MAG: alpha-amylase family glycosyl hydrolase, partial [Planctomycetota bacterium]
MKPLWTDSTVQRFRKRFEALYGARADACLGRLAMFVGRYGVGSGLFLGRQAARPLTEQDAVLITYGDTIRRADEKPLRTLRRFLEERLTGVVNTVHILPFFPYSSDDGFAVTDYRTVRPELGRWQDIRAIGARFRLMFDLVLNHASVRGPWFQDYLNGILPGRRYFLERDAGEDLSQVVRPRSSPLLTEVLTPLGPRRIWTTFGADQADLNFANPDVFFEMLDILFLYLSMGAGMIRLDAIAYLWKEPGTPCIHLPQTHEIVKLLRDILSYVSPQAILVTETNVPHAENVSYFGAGDEAHMVYRFGLPPLVLHALRSGSARPLTRWAEGLSAPPEGCAFLNFTASHDGIGLRPIEGILTARERDEFLKGLL